MKRPVTSPDLKYTLKVDGNKGSLTLGWENVAASVPFTVK